MHTFKLVAQCAFGTTIAASWAPYGALTALLNWQRHPTNTIGDLIPTSCVQYLMTHVVLGENPAICV